MSDPIQQIVLQGGPTFTLYEGFFEYEKPYVTPYYSFPESVYKENTFTDNVYFNTVSLIMSNGDPNAVMLSENAIWGNLESLTVKDIIDNLELRAASSQPPMVGKYALPLGLIKEHREILKMPLDTQFTHLCQDQFMVSITNSYVYQLNQYNLVADNINLFGSHYFNSADAWAAIIKDRTNDSVDQVLHRAGVFTNNTSKLNQYTRRQFISLIKEIYRLANLDIIWRIENNSDRIISGQNVYKNLSGKTIINGYVVGNNDFTELNGGYFFGYAYTPIVVTDATIGPSSQQGCQGTVSVKLFEAGSAALVAVLQTDNEFDQAGIAQVIINRTGATINQDVNFIGRTVWENSTQPGTWSGISAAMYGDDTDPVFYAAYGNLFVEPEILKAALGEQEPEYMKEAVQSLFRNTLTESKLNRLSILRANVYLNGPEINQLQVAVKGAINIKGPLESGEIELDYIIRPQGNNSFGYVTTPFVKGFWVPNSSDLFASTPAPSITALHLRLLENIKNLPPQLNFNYQQILNNQSNALVGSDIVSSANVEIIENELDIRRVSNQPDQPDTVNYSGGIPKIDPDYPSYDLNNMYSPPGQDGYNSDAK